jgi:hypothetical protein
MNRFTRGFTARWLRRPVLAMAALVAAAGFAAAPAQMASADS